MSSKNINYAFFAIRRDNKPTYKSASSEAICLLLDWSSTSSCPNQQFIQSLVIHPQQPQRLPMKPKQIEMQKSLGNHIQGAFVWGKTRIPNESIKNGTFALSWN